MYLLICALLHLSQPLAAASAAPQASLPAVTTEGAKPSPNVLMFCVDDLNGWIGCLHGHPDAKTPNIDRLAARGMLFSEAHSQVPLCGPSRCALMSGLQASTTGVYGQVGDDKIRKVSPLLEQAVFLPELFRQAGYDTAGAGKIFHNHAPKGVFDENFGHADYGPAPKTRFHWPTPEVQESVFKKGFRTATDWGAFPLLDEQMPDVKSADWIIQQLAKPRQKPFFLVAGFVRPHTPWLVPQHWFDLHPLNRATPPPYLPGDQDDVPAFARQLNLRPEMPTAEWAKASGQWPAIVQAYLACISFTDAQIGRILDALDKSPAKAETIVVLWSDHGYQLGEKNRFAKHALWQECTHIPMIIALPSATPGRCERPVQLIDLYPTLRQLCHLPAPTQTVDGHDLSPLLTQPNAPWPHPALSTYGFKNHKVTDGRYSFYRYADGSEELYDRQVDPQEWRNLASSQDQAAIKETLSHFLPRQNAPESPLAPMKLTESSPQLPTTE